MIATQSSIRPNRPVCEAARNRLPRCRARVLALLLALPALGNAEGLFSYTLVNEATVTITDYPREATGAVVIPAEIEGKPVTEIGDLAFDFCAGVTSVTIPEGVTKIGSQAFFNCSTLASVTIPSTVTSIGDNAFNLCIALTSAQIPAGVTSIGIGVFNSCQSLASVTIPEGVTSIGDSAFYNCKTLSSVAIPSTVTAIGASAFGYCSSLTSVVVPSGVTLIRQNCFSDCTGLTSVSLPAGVTAFEGSAFANCASLTGLAIPSTVTSIGSYAFYKCSSLTALTLPAGVVSIGSNAFNLCGALTSLTIPSGVTSLGVSTFENCAALASVTIPSSVTYFDNYVFRNCNSLTSVEITATTTTTLRTDVFQGCASLVSISVSESNPSFSSEGGVLFNKAKSTLHTYPRGLAGAYTVPSTVTSIGNYAFRFAGLVTGIQLPASVTSVGSEAFAGCSSLLAITVDAGNPNFSGANGVLFNKAKTTLVACPGAWAGAYAVPSGVTAITASAFRYCGGLTEVTLPVGVGSIGSNAFSNCGLLGRATFMGNAPGTFGTNVFLSAAGGFSVFFVSGATGFTTPTWQGYPCAETTAAADPLADWLSANGLPADADLGSDANHDGVSLLMAYALNLNPHQNLSGSLPKPVVSAGQMSLSFHAGADGITYAVETSGNLSHWTTEGVSVSEPDENQIRTATIGLDGQNRFLRLVVSH